MDFKKELSLFDVTSIIVGSVIGADIYIASAITAGLLGPFSLVIWIIAGIFAHAVTRPMKKSRIGGLIILDAKIETDRQVPA